MGLARWYDGGFDLSVAFLFRPSRKDLLAWQRSFRHASEILFEATHGQMRLHQVSFATQGALHEADIFVLPGVSGDLRASANQHAIGWPGFPITLYAHHEVWPAVIVHELGHYAMNLEDEYGRIVDGKASGPICTGSPEETHACLMGHGRELTRKLPRGKKHIEGVVRYFCGPGNHEPHSRTSGNMAESCWEQLSLPTDEGGYGLTIPDDTSGDYGLKAPAVRFRARQAQQLFSVVVDLSPDEEAYNVFRGIREGFEMLKDGVRAAGVDYQLVVNGQRKDRFHKRWKAIWDHPAKRPGLVSSLETALAYLLKEDEEADSCEPANRGRAIFLVSRGTGHMCGLEAVIKKLLLAQIRVFAIAVSEEYETSPLRDICRRTGGRYERLHNVPDQLDVVRNVQESLAFAVAAAFDNYGTIEIQRCNANTDDPKARVPIHVEHGCEELIVLVVADAHPGHHLEILNPDGERVGIRDIRYRRERTYIAASINPRSDSGVWHAVVRPLTGRARRSWHRIGGFTVVALSRNPRIHAAIRAETPVVKQGSTATVPAFLRHLQPAGGTKAAGETDTPQAELLLPDGEQLGHLELIVPADEKDVVLDRLIGFQGTTPPLDRAGLTRLFVRITNPYYSPAGFRSYRRMLQHQIEVLPTTAED